MTTGFLILAAILLITAVQVALQIIAARDLGRRERVRGGNRWLWIIVILLFLPGVLVYFAFGRLPNSDRSGLTTG